MFIVYSIYTMTFDSLYIMEEVWPADEDIPHTKLVEFKLRQGYWYC
jgi:hypothetical protein